MNPAISGQMIQIVSNRYLNSIPLSVTLGIRLGNSINVISGRELITSV